MELTLFILLGYPGSGKTTFAKKLCASQKLTRVSYDELRNKMWLNQAPDPGITKSSYVIPAIDYATERLLSAGRSVVYDLNSNTAAQRSAIATLALRSNAKPVVLWVQTSLDVAHIREGKRELLENHRMSDEKFQRLARELEVPHAEEVVIIINGEQSFAQQMKTFHGQMDTLLTP